MGTPQRLSAGLTALAAAVAVALTGCTAHPEASPPPYPAPPSGPPATSAPSGSTAPSPPPNAVPGVTIPSGQIDAAVGRLDGLAHNLMSSSGVPGMAVAVVHDGKTVYAKGFGVRSVKSQAKVDANTVFQLASMSKSVGATVVAHQVGQGTVGWDTPVHTLMPTFSLSDPYVTDHVTVGDLYAHRSGLPDHAGDLLEDLGYDRGQVLSRLKYLPLAPFRDSYAYTNFGVTAAAQAVADASGTDWATLSQQAIYGPLGMTSTSSRYSDYLSRSDRAVPHVKVDGKYQVSVPGRQPDAQSPAGGVSSSANDLAKWMAMVLADGKAGGKTVVEPQALLPAVSPQSVSEPPTSLDTRAGFYGYGFNVTENSAGRVQLSHSGAFDLGAATSFTLLPSAHVGIVTLTNAAPVGVPEALNAEFADLVQFGKVREDWTSLYRNALTPLNDPVGSLVGQSPPANATPAAPLESYVGVYGNAYYGAARIDAINNALVMTLGPKNMQFTLTHWDGNTFVFTPTGENAPPGSISKATFDGNNLILEYYDKEHLGTFTRA